MPTLYVEFTRPETFSLISTSIMIFEKATYSHVRFQWEDDYGPLVYEASGSSVKFLGEVAQQENPVIVVHRFALDLNDQQWSEFKRLRLKYAGVSYGVSQIVGIVLSRLLFLKNNPFSQGHISQVCSEIVARILHDIFKLDLDIDFDMAGPKKIHQLLENYEKKTDIIHLDKSFS